MALVAWYRSLHDVGYAVACRPHGVSYMVPRTPCQLHNVVFVTSVPERRLHGTSYTVSVTRGSVTYTVPGYMVWFRGVTSTTLVPQRRLPGGARYTAPHIRRRLHGTD